MSEVFGNVETAEDHICEIMELFCEVQAEICEEMVTNKEDGFEDEDEIDGQISVT